MSGQRVVLRPLLGASREGAKQGIPPGNFWEVQNWVSSPTGLRTTKGWQRKASIRPTGTQGGYAHDFELLVGGDVAFQGALTSKGFFGAMTTLLVGRHFAFELVYSITNGFTPSFISFPSTGTYTTGITASSSGGVVSITGAAMTFVTDGVGDGDCVTIVVGTVAHTGVVDANVATPTETTLAVRVFGSDPGLTTDAITLYVHGGFDHGTGMSLGGNTVGNIDWAAYHSGVVFADSENGLWNYNGSDISQLDVDTTVTGIKAVAFHDGRLWAYDLEDSGTHHPYRIRWTTQADLTTFPAANFQDIPFSKTGGERIVGLNNLMVAFTGTEVFLGTPTNLIGLPYSFAPFDTGGIGLAGKRALLSWRDGIVFVGQDDLYYLGGGSSLESFGSEYIARAVRTCVENGQGHRIRLGWNAYGDRISVFLPENAAAANTYYDFTIATKQWSSRVFNAAFSFRGFAWMVTSSPERWSDANTTWTAVSSSLAWEDFTPDVGTIRQYAFMVDDTDLEAYSQVTSPTDTESDGTAHAHTRVLTSGAIDCGTPDQRKLFNRLTLRLGDQAPSAVDFTLRVKGSSRNTWTTLGYTATIAAGDYATRFSFREFGSTLEFELTTTSNLDQAIEIVELILDYHPAGSQVRY